MPRWCLFREHNQIIDPHGSFKQNNFGIPVKGKLNFTLGHSGPQGE